MEWTILYLTAVNSAAFLLFAADKKRAKEKKRRISEKTLFAISLLGGKFGRTFGNANLPPQNQASFLPRGDSRLSDCQCCRSLVDFFLYGIKNLQSNWLVL